MDRFNQAICALGVIEIPLHGRHFTWSNKQFNPLLERLERFFTSSSWTIKYPRTLAKALVMETSDHFLALRWQLFSLLLFRVVL